MTKDIKGSLIWAGALIAVGFGATMARKLGYIDADTTTRVLMIPIGLMVAWYGNRTPKAFAASAHARKVNRVSGWSMALSGLVYAGLWAVAPLDVALAGGCGAIIAGMAVTLAYCRSLRARAKAA